MSKNLDQRKTLFIFITKNYEEYGNGCLSLNISSEVQDTSVDDNYSFTKCDKVGVYELIYTLCLDSHKNKKVDFFTDYFTIEGDNFNLQVDKFKKFVEALSLKLGNDKNIILSCHFPGSKSREDNFNLVQNLNAQLTEQNGLKNVKFSFYSSLFKPKNTNSVEKFFKQMELVAEGENIMPFYTMSLCNDTAENLKKDYRLNDTQIEFLKSICTEVEKGILNINTVF